VRLLYIPSNSVRLSWAGWEHCTSSCI